MIHLTIIIIFKSYGFNLKYDTIQRDIRKVSTIHLWVVTCRVVQIHRGRRSIGAASTCDICGCNWSPPLANSSCRIPELLEPPTLCWHNSWRTGGDMNSIEDIDSINWVSVPLICRTRTDWEPCSELSSNTVNTEYKSMAEKYCLWWYKDFIKASIWLDYAMA